MGAPAEVKEDDINEKGKEDEDLGHTRKSTAQSQ